MAEVLAIEPGGMPCGVPKLVQRRGVVTIARRNSAAPRQGDRIIRQTIERTVTRDMTDADVRPRQDRLRPLVAVPFSKSRACRGGRQTVDLRRIEYCGGQTRGRS